MMGASCDWSAEVRKLPMPVMLVFADNEDLRDKQRSQSLKRAAHVVCLLKLRVPAMESGARREHGAGGGLYGSAGPDDAFWIGAERRSRNRGRRSNDLEPCTVGKRPILVGNVRRKRQAIVQDQMAEVCHELVDLRAIGIRTDSPWHAYPLRRKRGQEGITHGVSG
jgi:hypothetical protein